jgi:LuxR family transcriptional regulator, maltose regulon positive regulatory protein
MRDSARCTLAGAVNSPNSKSRAPRRPLATARPREPARKPVRESRPQPSVDPAKLSPPRLAGVYPRKRLFKELDGLRRHSVSWIGAPAGSGKTILVASYLRARRLGCLWYQMDSGDADLANLFHDLGNAAERATPRQRRALPKFTAEYRADAERFAQSFFRAMAARLPARTVLVLDNFHEAGEDSRYCEILRAGIEELAPRVHVVVMSRTEPPAAFARMRANRQLACLDSQELILREEESRAVASRLARTPLALTSAQVTRLHRQCEGWMAGLILLLQRSDIAPSAAATGDAQSTQALFDYFASEVFAHRPDDAREFLMATALFTGFTDHMAERLTGNSRARAMLDDLVRQHHFTERLAETQPTYQYHPLFLQFLREQARKAWDAGALAERRRAAAAILEEHRRPEQALSLYIDAGDTNSTVRLILEIAPALVESGRLAVLAMAIARLPTPLVAQHPWLQFWQGSCRLVTDVKAALVCFEGAYREFRARRDVRGSYLSWTGIVDCFVFLWDDFSELRKWIAEFHALRREFPDYPGRDVEERAVYAVFTAHVFARPEAAHIGEWTAKAEHVARNSADPNLRIMTVAALGYFLPWLGEFARYEAVMHSARVLARSASAAPLARLNVLCIESRNALLNGEPGHSLAVARETAAIAAEHGVHILDRSTWANVVWSCAHLGQLDEARAALEKYRLALQPGHRLDETQWFYLAGYVDSLGGDAPRAEERCRAALCLAQGAGTPIALVMCQMSLARVLCKRGAFDEARALLDEALSFTHALGSPLYELECWLVYAWIASRAGDERACLEHLQRAFGLANSCGFKSCADWDPTMMADLCQIALEHDVHAQTVRQLIRSRSLLPNESAVVLDSWPWPVRIRTLGRFELCVNDEPVRFSTKAQKKPLELLRVLVALGGQDVAEEHITEILWPDSDGDAAHRAFDTTLHRLRKLLGCEQAITVEAARISLSPRHVWLDICAFERKLRQADLKVPQLLDSALALYRGPFLGREAARWAVLMRERLRSMFLRGIEDLGRIYDERSRPHQAIECYRRGIEVDPLAETLHRRLMLHYAQHNQLAEALAVYQRLHTSLTAQLGVKPSAETQALYEILRREKRGALQPSRTRLV